MNGAEPSNKATSANISVRCDHARAIPARSIMMAKPMYATPIPLQRNSHPKKFGQVLRGDEQA